MSYTGSAAETRFPEPSSATIAPAGRSHAGGRGPVGLSSPSSQSSGAHAGPSSEVLEACGATAAWLIRHQADDGHWRGPLEGDTILESEYLLILAWTGSFAGPHVAGAVLRILRQQLPDGGWAIYRGGPVDISASVKAYFALKIFGQDPGSEPMVRARRAIAAAGGPWAVNSFTRFYLALLGQMSYADCPAVPPEIVLLPDWFPVNLHRVSAWSRTMIVPLSLIWAFKPMRQLAESQGIGELFADSPRLPGMGRLGGDDGWARFFRGVDKVLKAFDAVGFRPFRSRAVAECRRWMLERFDGSDGLGAIFPPIVWSIVALRAMGCPDDSPEVSECWRQLEGLIEHEEDGTTRIEPCRSPVWDTALTLRALAVERLARRAGGTAERGGDSSLDAAVDWLLSQEIRTDGDWSRRAPRVEPSGWCFEYANRFYPDVDDTAMVVIAFATWREGADGSVAADRRRIRLVNEAIDRSRTWLEAMQNSDGGWGAFDRDNNCELLCKVPFADHNAMIDPSSPDLAGRVLEALGRIGLRVGHPGIDRAVRYLRNSQEKDGSWYGRWGVNYVYGTWQTVEGLRAIGVPADDAVVVSAAEWLASHQQSCGGWGESPDSYADPRQAGRGEPTPSQTAWGVAGLLAAGRHDSPETLRGVQWLVDHQASGGDWLEENFTGTGFPKVFYLRYHWYRVYFPLMALGRWWMARSNGHRGGHDASAASSTGQGIQAASEAGLVREKVA